MECFGGGWRQVRVGLLKTKKIDSRYLGSSLKAMKIFWKYIGWVIQWCALS